VLTGESIGGYIAARLPELRLALPVRLTSRHLRPSTDLHLWSPPGQRPLATRAMATAQAPLPTQ
jgi:hypothetical protein